MTLEDLNVAEQNEYSEWAEATAQQQFEQRKWSVKCGICGRVAKDTQQNLERAGWVLSSAAEFCPSHKLTNQCQTA
jgi:hypothetical protein